MFIVAVDAWLEGRGELGPNVSNNAEKEGKEEQDMFISPTTGEDVVPLLEDGVTADCWLAFCIALSFMN